MRSAIMETSQDARQIVCLIMAIFVRVFLEQLHTAIQTFCAAIEQLIMESNVIMEINLDAQQIVKSIWDIIVCQISVFSQCAVYVAIICYKVTSNVTMATI